MHKSIVVVSACSRSGLLSSVEKRNYSEKPFGQHCLATNLALQNRTKSIVKSDSIS